MILVRRQVEVLSGLMDATSVFFISFISFIHVISRLQKRIQLLSGMLLCDLQGSEEGDEGLENIS